MLLCTEVEKRQVKTKSLQKAVNETCACNTDHTVCARLEGAGPDRRKLRLCVPCRPPSSSSCARHVEDGQQSLARRTHAADVLACSSSVARNSSRCGARAAPASYPGHCSDMMHTFYS
eukprot:5560259-Pleurochrysis_carterae.AAC.2